MTFIVPQLEWECVRWGGDHDGLFFWTEPVLAFVPNGEEPPTPMTPTGCVGDEGHLYGYAIRIAGRSQLWDAAGDSYDNLEALKRRLKKRYELADDVAVKNSDKEGP